MDLEQRHEHAGANRTMPIPYIRRLIPDSGANHDGTATLRSRGTSALRCGFVSLLLLIHSSSAAQFWVAPDGCDTNPATAQKPLATFSAALRMAREFRRLAKTPLNAPVKIILRGGVYTLTEPAFVRNEDSGTEKSPTVIAAAPDERPVLSGGVQIEGWHTAQDEISGLPAAVQKEIWMAEAPKIGGRVLEFRQLWINGRKAVRAREPNGENLFRLTAWDKRDQTAWIPATAVSKTKNPSQFEMVIDQVWEIAVLRVKEFEIQGANARATFQQPESRLEFEHPWPPVIVNSNYAAPFFLADAIEFLDEPGEWFEDLASGKLFYWPRKDEDLTRAKVFAPALQTAVEISGTPDSPVSNIRFKGISFEHTTWLRPSQSGHVPLQAGMFLLDAYRLSPKGTPENPKLDNAAWIGRPPACVSIKNANHISFERCRFEHTASAAVDFQRGTHDDVIEGCLFRDIGGNGIQVGKFSDPGIETHAPYNPQDRREICSREKIFNNVITDCGAEDWGCVGVCVGYAREISIEHNEISGLPYTGISIGWGWTKATNCMGKNFILANRIRHVGQKLGDLGGIYTLSAQPGTVVAGNSISDIHPSKFVPDPEHWFCLYADEGSSFITFRDNWCPAEKFLRNANGPGNVWTNNGPIVSEKIKRDAGLEAAFRDLLNH